MVDAFRCLHGSYFKDVGFPLRVLRLGVQDLYTLLKNLLPNPKS